VKIGRDLAYVRAHYVSVGSNKSRVEDALNAAWAADKFTTIFDNHGQIRPSSRGLLPVKVI